MTSYAALAGQVLQAHPDHPGYRWATQELTNLLDDAHTRVAAGRSVDGETLEYARLASHGVSPLHILSMMAAVALFDQANPGFLKDTRVYQFAIARAVIGLTSRQGERTNARTLEAIHARLWPLYSPLISRVVEAVNAREARERTRYDALSVPLSNPT